MRGRGGPRGGRGAPRGRFPPSSGPGGPPGQTPTGLGGGDTSRSAPPRGGRGGLGGFRGGRGGPRGRGLGGDRGMRSGDRGAPRGGRNFGAPRGRGAPNSGMGVQKRGQSGPPQTGGPGGKRPRFENGSTANGFSSQGFVFLTVKSSFFMVNFLMYNIVNKVMATLQASNNQVTVLNHSINHLHMVVSKVVVMEVEDMVVDSMITLVTHHRLIKQEDLVTEVLAMHIIQGMEHKRVVQIMDKDIIVELVTIVSLVMIIEVDIHLQEAMVSWMFLNMYSMFNSIHCYSHRFSSWFCWWRRWLWQTRLW